MVTEAKTWVWEEFGEAGEWSAFRRGKLNTSLTVFSVGRGRLTSSEFIVEQWKKHFNDLLNSTNMHS